MRHQSATAHELARIAELAGVPGEKLARLGERMSREEIEPGASIGEPGRFFDGSATAVTPATVAGCPRADYESLIAD